MFDFMVNSERASAKPRCRCLFWGMKMLAVVLAVGMMLMPKNGFGDGFLDDDLDYWFESDSETRVYVSGLKNASATRITIPSTVRYEYTEYSYDNDTGETIAHTRHKTCTVTSIGDWAFYGCSGLTGDLKIPNSVTSIGNYAFYGCSGLTGDLTIPNSVTSIGEWIFGYCNGLTGKLTIPDGVTSIGNCAFACCSGLTGDLTIPNSVTSIGDGAFFSCSGLTGDLTIPNRVTSIGGGAFEDCSGLTGKLTIPNSVTSIGDDAFRGCSGLTGDLTIPNGVTSIGESVFFGCSGLTGDLTIPNGVTSIEAGAFYDCYGFTGKLTIPISVKSVGVNAFHGCFGLTGDLTIPASVTSIGAYAFYGCSGLTGKLTIPESVTSIENYVFHGCSGLTGDLKMPNGLTSIGSEAFCGCSGLTGDLTIPESVTSIGGAAFSGCNGLTGDLTIPNGVTSIGAGAFGYCSGLTGTLTIPESVTDIGYSAFLGCSGLTGDLIIPSSVMSIGNWAFQNCSGLTSVTVYEGVKSIGVWAFLGCGSIVFMGKPPEVVNTYYDDVDNERLFVGGNDGTYTAKYKAEWEAKIEDGYWHGLKMDMVKESPDFMVRLHGNGGTPKDGKEPIEIAFLFDESKDITTCPFKRGTNKFLGWQIEGIPYESRSQGFFDQAHSSDFSLSESAIEYLKSVNVVTDEDGIPVVDLYAIWTTSFLVTFYDCDMQHWPLEPDYLNDHVSWQWSEEGTRSWRKGGERVEVPPGRQTIFLKIDSGYDQLMSFAQSYDPGYGLEVRVKSKIDSDALLASDGSYCDGIYEPVKLLDGPIKLPDGRWKWKTVRFECTCRNTDVGIDGLEAFNPSKVTVIVRRKYNVKGQYYSSKEIGRFSANETIMLPTGQYMANFMYANDSWGPENAGGDVAFELLDSISTWVDVPMTFLPFGGSPLLRVSSVGKLTEVFVNGAEAVKIPVDVTSIGDEAFKDCAGLKSVTIPASVTEIADGAFVGCLDLEEFVVAENNPAYSVRNGLLCSKAGDKVVACPCALNEVTIPSSVTVIGTNAFKGGSLKSLTIPDNVTRIGAEAFEDCSSLTSVLFEGNAPIIEEHAFQGVTSDCTIYVHANSTGWRVAIPGTWNGVKIAYVESLPDWRSEMIAGHLDTSFAKAQTVLGALYGRDGAPVGTVQVKVGKINKKKGTVKISTTATLLADGKAKKVTAKAVNVEVVEANGADAQERVPPTEIPFKAPIGDMEFEVEADGTFSLKNGSYVMAEKSVGGNWTRVDARVYVDGGRGSTALSEGTIEELLPDGEPVIPKTGKWSFAKAAGVKYAKDKATGEFDLVVDTKKGTNRSAMKLTYTPKTGIFKGSFKIYAIQGGKLKKVTVKVIGVVVDGKGWGSATGPGGVSFAVTVE